MKVIVTIKRHNKDANVFCKEIEMTPQEYDNLKDISRDNCIVSAYVHQI